MSGSSYPTASEAGSPPVPREAAERGQRRHRGGNRGGKPNRGRDEAQQKPVTKRFVGKEESLGDEFVYQLTTGSEASDQYARTTEEIVRYTSTKYKQGGDVERSLSDGVRMVIDLPAVPEGELLGNGTIQLPTDPDMQVWKMRASMALQ